MPTKRYYFHPLSLFCFESYSLLIIIIDATSGSIISMYSSTRAPCPLPCSVFRSSKLILYLLRMFFAARTILPCIFLVSELVDHAPLLTSQSCCSLLHSCGL
ncbi:hypothetical protein BDV98DRAFT_190319 [Pterulicium gracile]|uniref:Uncharacterized protein n=1 Tax=Pterulicium gracile TaxID=1884261 RepID=A0A5C3QES1_9AGAR|nr:hypothetical protein BDV98DRAFT_190319 [Pterula gracilis]